MGNYKLNPEIGKRLSKGGHEVYCIEQLNGRESTPEYTQQLIELDPDILYYEMLDLNTFQLISKHFKHKLKILCYASKGILENWDDIISKQGSWYDKILTNSNSLSKEFIAKGISTQHFKYYFSVIDKEKLTFTPKYAHDCVFLGMGFGRLDSEDYELERNIFFDTTTEFDYGIYGNGWIRFDGHKHFNHVGILDPEDIGNLYHSTTSAVAIIAKGQREHGMINNRYTEIATSMCPIISFPYEEIDWYGLDRYITFVENKNDFHKAVKNWKDSRTTNPEQHTNFLLNQMKFMEQFDVEFFEKLKILMT